MILKEVYEEAIMEEYESLTLLIEFLILEKQVLAWESEYTELHLYFKPNNEERMNKLLLEYRGELIK